MLPSRLFRSRWSALAWAAGVVWFAVEVAQSAPTPRPAAAGRRAAAADATGEAVTAGDLAVLANAMGR